MRESDYYQPNRNCLEAILRAKFKEFHLEITARKRFTNVLKSQVSQHRDIIFHFLRETAPDITGFVKEEYSTDFVVAEVKRLHRVLYALLALPRNGTLALARFDRQSNAMCNWFPRNPFE